MSRIEVTRPDGDPDFYTEDSDKYLRFGFKVTTEGALVINRLEGMASTPYAAYPEGFWIRVQTAE